MNYSLDNRQFNCTQEACETWKIMHTIYGVCCSLNFHPSNTSKAYSSNEWGKGTGISVIFTGQIASNSGFNVFIHHCAEYLTKATSIFPMIPGYEHFIRISPQLNVISKHYTKLSIMQRKCLLTTEQTSKSLKQSRCRLISFANAIHRICGCHPYFMPVLQEIETSTKNCTAIDIRCFNHDSGKNFYLLLKYKFLICL